MMLDLFDQMQCAGTILMQDGRSSKIIEDLCAASVRTPLGSWTIHVTSFMKYICFDLNDEVGGYVQQDG